MKTLFTLLAAALLPALTILICPPLPLVAPVVPPHQVAALAPAAPTVRCLARSGAAGHVADVVVWSSGRVVKGQLLARISIPVSTPALQRAQRDLAKEAAAYEAQATTENYQSLWRARARLADVPRYVRDSYVVAPATGRLVRSLLVNGQYLPRGGGVAIIEVPARAAGTAAAPMVVALPRSNDPASRND